MYSLASFCRLCQRGTDQDVDLVHLCPRLSPIKMTDQMNPAAPVNGLLAPGANGQDAAAAQVAAVAQVAAAAQAAAAAQGAAAAVVAGQDGGNGQNGLPAPHFAAQAQAAPVVQMDAAQLIALMQQFSAAQPQSPLQLGQGLHVGSSQPIREAGPSRTESTEPAGLEEKKGTSFFMFQPRQETDVDWKQRDGVNRARYIALVDVHSALDALQKQFFEAEVCPPEMVELFDRAMRGLYTELEFILVAETFEGGWATVRKTSKLGAPVFALDAAMAKRVQEAESQLKAERASNRGRRWPFQKRGVYSGPRQYRQSPHFSGQFDQNIPMANEYGQRLGQTPYGAAYGPPQSATYAAQHVLGQNQLLAQLGQYGQIPQLQLPRKPIGPCFNCGQYGHHKNRCNNGSSDAKDKPLG